MTTLTDTQKTCLEIKDNTMTDTPVIHLRDFPPDKLQRGLDCVLEFQESGYPQCGYGVHSDEAFELIFCEYTKTRNITARYSKQSHSQSH